MEIDVKYVSIRWSIISRPGRMSSSCLYDARSSGEGASTVLSEPLIFKLGASLSSDSAVRLLALELGAVTSSNGSGHVGVLSKAAMVVV